MAPGTTESLLPLTIGFGQQEGLGIPLSTIDLAAAVAAVAMGAPSFVVVRESPPGDRLKRQRA